MNRTFGEVVRIRYAMKTSNWKYYFFPAWLFFLIAFGASFQIYDLFSNASLWERICLTAVIGGIGLFGWRTGHEQGFHDGYDDKESNP